MISLSGEVLGVAAGGREDGRLLSFAIPIGRLRALLAGLPAGAWPRPFAPSRRARARKDDVAADPDFRAALDARGRAELKKQLECATRLYGKYPGDPAANCVLGRALGDLDLDRDAEEAFRRAAGLAPGSAEAWSGLGLVLWKQKRHHECVAALRSASRLKPHDSQLLLGLGLAQVLDGDLTGAQVTCTELHGMSRSKASVLERAIRDGPSSPSLRRPRLE